MATIRITHNDAELYSVPSLVDISTTNKAALRAKQARTRGGVASVRFGDPNPDIEFVETGVTNAPDPGAGKSERAIQAHRPPRSGRRPSLNRGSGFDTIAGFQRPAETSVSIQGSPPVGHARLAPTSRFL